jgi:uncharacterized protein (TIGR03790 family)
MRKPMRGRWFIAWCGCFLAAAAWAGGSGLNVVVVVNQNSTNSLQLGNDFCERRGVPPQNVLRLSGWTGGAVTWARADFEARLLNPLLAMVAANGLSNQGQYVLLSMDIPYRVTDGASQNSTTSALFYGFKTNTTPPVGLPVTCCLPDASTNSYVFSELPFDQAHPQTAPTNSFLAMMLTDTSLGGAEQILRNGVASDSTFPTQAVYLEKTTDSARSVRFTEFDDAVFDAHVRGDYALTRISGNGTTFTNILGLLTGLATFALPTNAFVPGALGDSLTSYGGEILESSGQTSLLAFLDAGAAGSYGTVVEPCNYTQKFPHPLDYFYQNRGFSLAEAYYQSVRNPFEGLLVGEPLAAPFARPGAADWSALTNGTVLSGPAALNLAFSAAATNLPLAQADLFIDGTRAQTLTNIPPSAGNSLSATLNGIRINYTVPVAATLASVASGLAASLNGHSSQTKVMAYPIGDRLELDSLNRATPGSNVTVSVSATAGSAAQLTTTLWPARPTFLDSIAAGYLSLTAGNAPAVGDWLRLVFTKTNGALVTVSVTNTTSGTALGTLVQTLINQVNATLALQGSDGVTAGDLNSSSTAAHFFIYARSAGWAAAQIQVAFSASSGLVATPAGPSPLESNLSDLQPRNHLYLSSGWTLLPVNFVLDTPPLADGFHELAVVAYEGTSVRTQTRVSRTVQVQNTTLSATLTPLIAGTNVTLDTPLQLAATANSTNIARIELFSTGGSLGVVSNQPAALFLAPAAMLGLGLHPFYAVLQDTLGHTYRTATIWIRLVPAFNLSLTGPPWVLAWPAMPGLGYEILAATNIPAGFQPVASVTASNSILLWPLSGPGGDAVFYRVRLLP